jgi:hypothetical protein
MNFIGVVSIDKLIEKHAKKLTYKEREELPDSDFVYPGERKYPINDKCISGDTEILLLNGISVPIKDLVGKEVWVYSYDLIKKAIVPARAINIHKTIDNAEVIELVLDNNKSIICTKNHPILKRDGTYIEAGSIHVGESLMPLYRKYVTQQSINKQYEKIYQPWYRFWEFTHHMVCREYNIKPIISGNIIHHINENNLDNDPNNLREMTRSSHLALHGELGSVRVNLQNFRQGSIDRWKKPGAKEKQAAFMKKENQRRKDCGELYLIGKKITESKLKYTKDELATAYKMYIDGSSLKDVSIWWNCCVATVKSRFERENLPYKKTLELEKEDSIELINNHKVVSILSHNAIDVYDMTVEDTHNFAIAAGIFIHNSHAQNALSRVEQHGTPAEKAKVKREVKKKYPGMGVE